MTAADVDRARRDGGTVLETLRVLVVAGVPVGALVVGVGGHLAMLLLRVTSPDQVRGVVSDDGFTIGRVTLAGSYNLLQLGAGVGILGVGVYLLVAPWLIGPRWFRRLTVALAAAAVVGSGLLHADGVDFNVLEPTWLAIALFVALPGVFAVATAVATDRAMRPRAPATRGRRWVPSVLLVACFAPDSLAVLAVASIVVLTRAALWQVPPIRWIRRTVGYGFVLRAFWLSIAVVGAVALARDVRAIAEATGVSIGTRPASISSEGTRFGGITDLPR